MRLPPMTTRRWLIAVAIVAVLAGAARAMERRARLRTSAQARYAAALRVYQGTQRKWYGGELFLSEMYVAMRMLREAQSDLDGPGMANQAHLQRLSQMKAAFGKGPGCNLQSEIDELEYMVKEAEYWSLKESW